MRRYYLIFMLFMAAMVFLPKETKAQYTNPYETYRTNDLIRRMPKKKTINRTAKKNSRIHRNKSSKSSVRRKKRHFSQIPEFIHHRDNNQANPDRRVYLNG